MKPNAVAYWISSGRDDWRRRILHLSLRQWEVVFAYVLDRPNIDKYYFLVRAVEKKTTEKKGPHSVTLIWQRCYCRGNVNEAMVIIHWNNVEVWNLWEFRRYLSNYDHHITHNPEKTWQHAAFFLICFIVNEWNVADEWWLEETHIYWQRTRWENRSLQEYIILLWREREYTQNNFPTFRRAFMA